MAATDPERPLRRRRRSLYAGRPRPGLPAAARGTRLRRAPRELNAQLGLALASGAVPARFVPWLERVQNDLFDVGADISVPHGGDRARLRLAPEQTTWLEQACDEVNADLPSLRSFVLPGGTAAAAQLHVCRTVCRRAERRTIACGAEVNAECVRYLNRLSDLLFILSRGLNVAAGEHLRRVVELALELRPVAAERARERVELPQTAVLGGEQPLIAHRYRPGSHSGSPSPAATFTARERMNSRSERRLR